MIERVITTRDVEMWPSHQILYEYEDIFSKELGIPLDRITEKEYYSMKARIIRRLPPRISKYKFYLLHHSPNENRSIAFIMDLNKTRFYRKNVIPIFVDVWRNELSAILNITKELDLFFVVSKDIHNEIKRLNPKSNVAYLPLSISDKWVCNMREKMDSKCVDVIQFGRRSEVLHQYMLDYLKKHGNVEYVYQVPKNSHFYYYSTTKGELGEMDTRDKFMALLGKCKISLVSATGYDGSRDTGQIYTVPARFYESAVNYCYMIGRYPNNQDFKMLNISSVCDNVTSYNQFEYLMDKYLSQKSFQKQTEYVRFIQNNVTSRRVRTVLDCLANNKRIHALKHETIGVDVM